MLRYMLDTNICIYVDRPSEVRRIFNERAEQLCISSVSQAELHYGAAKSESSARNLGVEDLSPRGWRSFRSKKKRRRIMVKSGLADRHTALRLDDRRTRPQPGPDPGDQQHPGIRTRRRTVHREQGVKRGGSERRRLAPRLSGRKASVLRDYNTSWGQRTRAGFFRSHRQRSPRRHGASPRKARVPRPPEKKPRLRSPAG